LKIKKGDYYNITKLKQAQTRLYDTSWFENVEPKFTFPGPGQLDVTFTVTEK
jgi:outer membrane protein assembly factor BamA